jgi:hypothetical protein
VRGAHTDEGHEQVVSKGTETKLHIVQFFSVLHFVQFHHRMINADPTF